LKECCQKFVDTITCSRAKDLVVGRAKAVAKQSFPSVQDECIDQASQKLIAAVGNVITAACTNKANDVGVIFVREVLPAIVEMLGCMIGQGPAASFESFAAQIWFRATVANPCLIQIVMLILQMLCQKGGGGGGLPGNLCPPIGPTDPNKPIDGYSPAPPGRCG